MIVSSATAIVIFVVFRGRSISKHLQVCGADLAVKFICFFKPHCDLDKFAKFAWRFVQIFKIYLFNLGDNYLHQMPLYSTIFDSADFPLS